MNWFRRDLNNSQYADASSATFSAVTWVLDRTVTDIGVSKSPRMLCLGVAVQVREHMV